MGRTSLRILLGTSLAIAVGTGAALWSTAGAAHTAAPPTVTILYGSAPDYLDPQESYTAQGDEALWVSYLGLYTYAHRSGASGGVVIPALATGDPKITDGGKTYTMTLRPNLVYSNGKPVKATDFAYSIERALKLNWGGDPYYTGSIVGAMIWGGLLLREPRLRALLPVRRCRTSGGQLTRPEVVHPLREPLDRPVVIQT